MFSDDPIRDDARPAPDGLFAMRSGVGQRGTQLDQPVGDQLTRDTIGDLHHACDFTARQSVVPVQERGHALTRRQRLHRACDRPQRSARKPP